MGDIVVITHHDLEVAQLYATWLGNAGWEPVVASSLESWGASWPSANPAVMLVELMSEACDNVSLLVRLRERAPRARTIGLLPRDFENHQGTPEEGWDELLAEPVEAGELVAAVNRLLAQTPRDDSLPCATRPWSAPATKALFEQASRFAEHDGTVLLLGESGTGKDHLARWIHMHSARRHGPFFTINCAALSRELAESELFGHESGAFTGTKGRKRGLLELADRGTLLLDEVGELEPPLQAKLLTFLDSRSFVRVGGERMVTVSARLLAATNRDLLIEVERGNFRRDLYYRLAVVPIRIPPLRERLDDLPQLSEQLLVALRQELSLSKQPQIDESACAILRRYHFPGNIRELRNVLARALMLSSDGIIRAYHLELEKSRDDFEIVIRFPRHGLSLHDVTRDVARRVVAEALRRTASKQDAAKLLGISRHALAHQIRVLGLEEPRLSGEFTIPPLSASSQQKEG